MKIFYFAPERKRIMDKWQHIHFLDELSRHGIQIDLFNPLYCRSWEEANEITIKKIREGNYDLFFTGVCRKEVLFIETLQEIKRTGCPTLCIRYDNLVIPFNDKGLAPFYDLVWLTAIETKHLYDKWGVKTCFAPYAANPFTFNYSELPLQHRVCFIGTPYGSRSRMINKLSQAGVETTVFYGGKVKQMDDSILKANINVPTDSFVVSIINRLKFSQGRTLLKGSLKNKLMGKCIIQENSFLEKENAVPFEELSSKYSEYSLSLASTSAHHTDVLNSPVKIINLRNFEIPMSGGVEICRYNYELSQYYEDGKEILFYESNEELVEKARYYTRKAADKEIYMIKQAARKRSENEHTWYHRFNKVLNELNIKI